MRTRSKLHRGERDDRRCASQLVSPLLALAAAVCLLGLASAPLALAESYTTNIINNVVTNAGSYYILGNNGPFNVLILTNNGVLSAATSWIGNHPASSNNSAIVTGVGSTWNTDSLEVGTHGASNQLLIQSGGVVSNQYGAIGTRSTGDNNTVRVSGAGSVWTSDGYIYVGYPGSGNRLIVEGGGVVSNGFGSAFINARIGFNTGSSNNAALVTGAGSVFNCKGEFQIGLSGSSNTLTIEDGGVVNDYGGVLGYSKSSSNNSVLVSGVGALWNNSVGMNLGYQGVSNRLTVANGGTVNAGLLTIGSQSSSFGNVLLVDGGNLFATNSVLNGKVDVRQGKLILNNGTVVTDRLIVTNGSSSVVNFNSGSLNTSSTLFNNGSAFVIGDGSGTATLNLNGGPHVFADGFVATTALSQINFSAGLLRSGGTTVSNGTAFVVGDGVQSATLDLNGGAHSFANGLLLSSNANLIGSGTIFGAATNFGGISPGHSAGLLAFAGDLTLMDSSVLTMEIGGPTTNDYDRIVVGGLLRISGLLEVTFTNGYAPDKGAVFDLFNYGSISGSFSQTNLPTFQYAGTDWDTSHLLAPASDPLSGSIIFIPEPASGLLLALGAGALAIRRGRRRI